MFSSPEHVTSLFLGVLPAGFAGSPTPPGVVEERREVAGWGRGGWNRRLRRTLAAQLTSPGVPRSAAGLGAVHQRARMLQAQCQDYLKKAEFALQAVSPRRHAQHPLTKLAWVTLLLPRATRCRVQGRPP